jgi:hypothetical protein
VGLFHLIRRKRIWFEPYVRQIRPERIWTRFSAARRASTTDGAGNPSARKSVGLFHLILRARIWFEPLVRPISQDCLVGRGAAMPVKASTMKGASQSLSELV